LAPRLIAFSAIQPAKMLGVHRWSPHFVRLAYAWLIVAGASEVWAAFAQDPDGIWGASRHSLTVGFVSTMIFAIGQRVLPAFQRNARVIQCEAHTRQQLQLCPHGIVFEAVGDFAPKERSAIRHMRGFRFGLALQ